MTTQNDTRQINPAALMPKTVAKMLKLKVGIVQKHIFIGF